MALTCYFFKFGKKTNSTAQPLLTSALLTCDITLHENCSVVNPVLLINTANLTDKNVFEYNFCYIPHFSRYYFINDWQYTPGLWIALCSVDPLASYKSQILAQTFYIMRSTYDSNNQVLFDGGVADSKYPVTTEQATYTANSITNPYEVDSSLALGGSFVVGIINSQSQNGAVSYYAMTPSAFLEFCNKMFTYSSGWLDIDPDEISESLQKALVNPFQYVASCVYLPIDISSIPGYTSTSTIYFGWWSVTMASSAKIVNSGMSVTTSSSLTIPRHPLAATRGKYLNVAPYSIYTLRYYPYGTIDIDSEAIASWSTLDLYSSVDVITGKGVLDIAVNGRANMIRTVEAQVGVQVPTASLQTNFTNIAAGKAGVIAAGASLVGKLNNIGGNVPNPADYSYNLKGFAGFTRDTLRSLGQDVKEAIAPGGDIKQTATDIMNSAVAASTTAEIQGMQGAGSLYQTESLSLSGRFLPIVTEDFIHTGRPLMQSRQLSTLSGFVICKDADCNFAATMREKAAIESYLTGGFFIE